MATSLKEFGTVQGGPYIGQRYEIVSYSTFPDWVLVRLGKVQRDIPLRFLEQESIQPCSQTDSWQIS